VTDTAQNFERPVPSGLFIALIIAAILTLALRLIFQFQLGILSTSSHSYTDLPRRLEFLFSISKLSPILVIPLFALWGAHKIRNMALFNENNFKPIFYILITLLIMQFGLDLYDTSSWADSLQDFKWTFSSLLNLLGNLAILLIIRTDSKTQFIPPAYGSSHLPDWRSQYQQGLRLLLVLAAVMIPILEIGFYGVFIFTNRFDETTSLLDVISLISDLSLRCCFSIAQAFLFFWAAHSIKSFSFLTPTGARVFFLGWMCVAAVSVLSAYGMDMLTSEKTISDYLFGKHQRWISLTLGISNLFIFSALIFIAGRSIQTGEERIVDTMPFE